MNTDSSNGQELTVDNSPEPNEDGCVLGTAGRDEDPNATTDWDHPDDPNAGQVLEPPGGGNQRDVTPVPNGTPGIDSVPATQAGED